MLSSPLEAIRESHRSGGRVPSLEEIFVAHVVVQARATPGLRTGGATVSTALELRALVQPAGDSTAAPRWETRWRRASTASEVATQEAPSYNEVQGAVRAGLMELLRQFIADWQRANPTVDPGSRPNHGS